MGVHTRCCLSLILQWPSSEFLGRLSNAGLAALQSAVFLWSECALTAESSHQVCTEPRLSSWRWSEPKGSLYKSFTPSRKLCRLARGAVQSRQYHLLISMWLHGHLTPTKVTRGSSICTCHSHLYKACPWSHHPGARVILGDCLLVAEEGFYRPSYVRQSMTTQRLPGSLLARYCLSSRPSP